MTLTLRINGTQAQLLADLLGGSPQIAFAGAEVPASEDLLGKLASHGFFPQPWDEPTAETAEPAPGPLVVHHYHHTVINAQIAEDNQRLLQRMADLGAGDRAADWKRGIRG